MTIHLDTEPVSRRPRRTGPVLAIAVVGALLVGTVIGSRLDGPAPTELSFASSVGEPPADPTVPTDQDAATPASGDAEPSDAGDPTDDQLVPTGDQDMPANREALEGCLAGEREALREQLRAAMEDWADREDLRRADGFEFEPDFDMTECFSRFPGLGRFPTGTGSVALGDGGFELSGFWDDADVRTCLSDEGVDIPEDASSISVRVSTDDGVVTAELKADGELIELDPDRLEAAMQTCLPVSAFPAADDLPDGIGPGGFDLDFDFGPDFPFGPDSPFGHLGRFGCDTDTEDPDADS